MNNPPSRPSTANAELAKLKVYLIGMIHRELEMRPPTLQDRQQAIKETLNQAYQSLNIRLPATVQEQLFHDILGVQQGGFTRSRAA